MPDLLTDVRYIKGIGEQRARSLNKLNIHTLRDLISYFPRSYDDRRSFRKIGELADGETACVEAMAAGAPTLSRVRKGMELVKVRVVDETGALELTFSTSPTGKTASGPARPTPSSARPRARAGKSS